MKKTSSIPAKLIIAFRKIFKRLDKKQKDNYQTFTRAGFTMFLSLTMFLMIGFNMQANAQTTLAAGVNKRGNTVCSI